MALPEHRLSLAEYLEWENAQDGRNEYYRGEVFATVGVSTAGLLRGGHAWGCRRSPAPPGDGP